MRNEILVFSQSKRFQDAPHFLDVIPRYHSPLWLSGVLLSLEDALLHCLTMSPSPGTRDPSSLCRIFLSSIKVSQLPFQLETRIRHSPTLFQTDKKRTLQGDTVITMWEFGKEWPTKKSKGNHWLIFQWPVWYWIKWTYFTIFCPSLTQMQLSRWMFFYGEKGIKRKAITQFQNSTTMRAKLSEFFSEIEC